MKLVITSAAEAELEHIGDFIALDSPRRAGHFIRDLRIRCERLLDMPKRFPLVPRFEQTGIRRLSHGEYLIFYRIAESEIEVLHILHGARDYEAVLFPEG